MNSTSYLEHELKTGQMIRIPQTKACVVCTKAYAEHDDFACNSCCAPLSNKEWNDLRLSTLSIAGIPSNEPVVVVSSL